MGNRRRSFRVGEKIQALVAHELIRIGDSRLSLVTVTSAQVTPDLRSAKIYWMVHGGEERRAEVIEALDELLPQIRKVIAQDLRTRYAPELRFYYDDSLDIAEKMDALFASIKTSDQG